MDGVGCVTVRTALQLSALDSVLQTLTYVRWSLDVTNVLNRPARVSFIESCYSSTSNRLAFIKQEETRSHQGTAMTEE